MQVTVNGRNLDAAVLKIKAGQEKKALEYLGKDGLDNVVFTLGADTFVANARELNLKGIEANQLVNYRGQVGRVLKVDSGSDMKSPKKAALWGTLVGGVAMPPLGLGMLAMFGIGMQGLFTVGNVLMFSGVGAVMFGLGGAALAALNAWTEKRHAKKADWGPYGVAQG